LTQIFPFPLPVRALQRKMGFDLPDDMPITGKED